MASLTTSLLSAKFEQDQTAPAAIGQEASNIIEELRQIPHLALSKEVVSATNRVGYEFLVTDMHAIPLLTARMKVTTSKSAPLLPFMQKKWTITFNDKKLMTEPEAVIAQKLNQIATGRDRFALAANLDRKLISETILTQVTKLT